MKRTASIALVFLLGIAVGATAAKTKLRADAFIGKDKVVAGAALLDVARPMAGKDSWENIAIGRILYLGGQKEAGQAIFDSVTRKEHGSDLIRIGRVYAEAGEWEKAKMAFDRSLELEPEDAPWMAEIGAYYMVHGDVQKAEELFGESVSIEDDNFWSVISMAAGYHGVKPQ